MSDFASSSVDITEIGLRSLAPDAEFQVLTERLHARFAVDAVLISIIDTAQDQQVFKGICAPAEVWSQARATPLSQSLCKLVVEKGRPLVLEDVERQISPTVSAAFRDLGVRSYLGTPLVEHDGQVIGALCLITTRERRTWTEADQTDLSLFALTINEMVAHRQTARKLDRADMALFATAADRTAGHQILEDILETMPGASFRYALFEDGTDAIEYLSDSCVRVYGYSADMLQGDPTLLWNAILQEDREAARSSVLYSARNLSFWQHDFRIERPDGTRRRLRGYGKPESMEGGVGVVWHTLVIDLDQIESDAARNSPLAPLQPIAL